MGFVENKKLVLYIESFLYKYFIGVGNELCIYLRNKEWVFVNVVE